MTSSSTSPSEQKVLSLSIWLTGGIATLGIVFGLLSGSQSIIFDGVFSLIDVAMSLLVLFVSRLLLKTGNRRFQYGYWHFEPLVAVFNGSILLSICLYALVNGVKGLLSGGAVVAIGPATVYAAIAFAACVGLYAYERQANKRLKSEFIRIDMESSLMSAGITLALFLGFFTAEILDRLGHSQYKPYADPVILILITCGLLPIPIGIVKRGLKDVFLIAPEEASQKVDEVMRAVQSEHEFVGYRSYVSKSGRIHVVDISILVDPEWPGTVAEMDAIRAKIAERLRPLASLEHWLTITFTGHREWL